MSAKRIVRRSRPRKGKTDWARLRHQTDEDIARAVASDPDAAPLADAEWVSAARVVVPERKQPVYLRLDGDVVRWFKESGPKYQTRINAVLRAYVGAYRRVVGEKVSKTQQARSSSSTVRTMLGRAASGGPAAPSAGGSRSPRATSAGTRTRA